MTKKVYISLPIKGRTREEVEKQSDKAIDRLVSLGLEPIFYVLMIINSFRQ